MIKEIKICYGTSCYISGNSDLSGLEDKITEKYGKGITVIKSGCMGLCLRHDNKLKPPFIKIDGEVMSGLTQEKIMEMIEKDMSGSN